MFCSLIVSINGEQHNFLLEDSSKDNGICIETLVLVNLVGSPDKMLAENKWPYYSLDISIA